MEALILETKDMNHLDKIISALYLAKSDNRERMLSDLIQNILYSINEPLGVDEIIKFINDTFHLEPIKYEIEEAISLLIDNRELAVSKNNSWLENHGVVQLITWIILVLVFLTELFGRAYIFNKERIKNGWSWAIGSGSTKSEILKNKKEIILQNYISENGQEPTS